MEAVAISVPRQCLLAENRYCPGCVRPTPIPNRTDDAAGVVRYSVPPDAFAQVLRSSARSCQVFNAFNVRYRDPSDKLSVTKRLRLSVHRKIIRDASRGAAATAREIRKTRLHYPLCRAATATPVIDGFSAVAARPYLKELRCGMNDVNAGTCPECGRDYYLVVIADDDPRCLGAFIGYHRNEACLLMPTIGSVYGQSEALDGR